jgi:IMP dehydrogenase
MDTVIGPPSAALLHESGGFGVLHRYCTIEEARQMFFDVVSATNMDVPNVMVAIGATGDYMERAGSLYDVGCRAFCIDVAHGHHEHVKNALSNLRKKYGSTLHIMTGNVATLEAFNDLADWGSDSIRVGVGGGSMCTTRIRTGHGIPTLQSIMDCAKSDRDVFIIADGGIRNSGDAVKAFAAGADMVMLGSLLAGHDESPGTIIEKERRKFKKFRGMASREAQLEWRGKVSVAEGDSTLIPYKGTMKDTLTDLIDGIKSGLSYSGARTIRELRSKAKFVSVSTSGVRENGPHGKNF